MRWPARGRLWRFWACRLNRKRPTALKGAVGRPESEAGFVLIAAIWMLVLAGSIAAVLVLRARATATESATEADDLQRTLAAEQVIETITADIALGGKRSPWSNTPAMGRVTIGKFAFAIEVTSEATRLDVNAVDLDRARAALAATRIPQPVANALLDQIETLRAAGKSVGTWAELEQLVSRAAPSDLACLVQLLTISSGLQQPFGFGSNSTEFAPWRVSRQAQFGEAIRIALESDEGRVMTRIVRITGQPSEPVLTMSSFDAVKCGQMWVGKQGVDSTLTELVRASGQFGG